MGTFEKLKTVRASEALIENTLKKAEEMPPKKKLPLIRIAAGIAAAAALVLIPFALFRGTRRPLALSNPWEREDFRAVTLGFVEKEENAFPASFTSYGGSNTPLRRLSGTASPEEETKGNGDKETESLLKAEAYTLPSLDGEIGLQSLIGERYLLWYDERALPMLYDLKTNGTIDLTERVFGVKRYLPDETIEDLLARMTQNGWYDPQADESGAVRRFLYHVLQSVYSLGDHHLDFASLQGCGAKDALIDVSYLSALPECRDLSDGEKKEALFSKAWSYADQLVDGMYPYILSVPMLDAASGKCLIVQWGFGRADLGWFFYDIGEDLLEGPLEDRTHCLNTMTHDYVGFRFGNNGNMLALTDPWFSSVGWPESEDADIDFASYRGEEIGLIDLSFGFTYRFSETLSENGGVKAPLAASAASLSDSGNLLYYRTCSWSGGAKNFFVPKKVFMNRFTIVPHEEDEWIFFRLSRQNGSVKEIPSFTLRGTFVRFAAEESVIVMKQDGKYRLYDAENGNEITSSVRTNGRMLLAHEYYAVTEEDGALWREHIFTGKREKLLSGDALCVSNDGAFVFGYEKGEKSAVCMNVYTLESVSVLLDDEFVSDLASVKNVGFDFRFHEETNVLTLTFRRTEEKAEEDTVDFFGLLEDPKFDGERFDAYGAGEEILPSLIPGGVPVNEYSPSETSADEADPGEKKTPRGDETTPA